MMRTKNSVMRDVERSYNKLITFQKQEVTKDENGIQKISDWITEIIVYRYENRLLEIKAIEVNDD